MVGTFWGGDVCVMRFLFKAMLCCCGVGPAQVQPKVCMPRAVRQGTDYIGFAHPAQVNPFHKALPKSESSTRLKAYFFKKMHINPIRFACNRKL